MDQRKSFGKKKLTLLVYLDLNQNTYKYFLIQDFDITAGELVKRILTEYVDHSEVESKSKEFSLYLINSVILDANKSSKRQTSEQISYASSDFEESIDSADLFPNVLKRKLNEKDKPVQILQRTKRRTYMKNPERFRWDLYFMRNSSKTQVKRNTMAIGSMKEDNAYNTLINNINDK